MKDGITVKRCAGSIELDYETLKDILDGMDLEPPGFIIYTFQGHLEDDELPPDQPTDPGKCNDVFRIRC